MRLLPPPILKHSGRIRLTRTLSVLSDVGNTDMPPQICSTVYRSCRYEKKTVSDSSHFLEFTIIYCTDFSVQSSDDKIRSLQWKWADFNYPNPFRMRSYAKNTVLNEPVQYLSTKYTYINFVYYFLLFHSCFCYIQSANTFKTTIIFN